MPDHDEPNAVPPEADETAVPPEQRGAAADDATPDPEPIGERSGGAGSATGGVLESAGGPPSTGLNWDESEDRTPTLAEELVQEAEESIGEVSPDMGTTKADPSAGGVRFEELQDKRKKGGLNDEEAEELGKFLAQREGREWTSTRSLRTHPADAS
jgi:hypothetical protein